MARLAQAGVPLPRPGDGLLRIHGQPAQGADWFALGPDRPAFAFAGLWRPWTGIRKGEASEHLLFAFLTTEANDVVRPIHAKAMPVILMGEDCDAWLEADVPTALPLQRPPPADRLEIVARGEKKDGAS